MSNTVQLFKHTRINAIKNIETQMESLFTDDMTLQDLAQVYALKVQLYAIEQWDGSVPLFNIHRNKKQMSHAV